LKNSSGKFGPNTSDKENALHSFFDLFPQRIRAEQYECNRAKVINQKIHSQKAGLLIPAHKSNPNQRVRRYKGSTKDSTIEDALKSELYAKVTGREKSADGSGSLFTIHQPSNDASVKVHEESNTSSYDRESFVKSSLTCEACLGRMVIHRCLKRTLPIDLDAIALEKKRKENEEIEKRKEKQRIANAKRREERRRKKEEEEKRKLMIEVQREEAKKIVPLPIPLDELQQQQYEVTDKKIDFSTTPLPQDRPTIFSNLTNPTTSLEDICLTIPFDTHDFPSRFNIE